MTARPGRWHSVTFFYRLWAIWAGNLEENKHFFALIKNVKENSNLHKAARIALKMPVPVGPVKQSCVCSPVTSEKEQGIHEHLGKDVWISGHGTALLPWSFYSWASVQVCGCLSSAKAGKPWSPVCAQPGAARRAPFHVWPHLTPTTIFLSPFHRWRDRGFQTNRLFSPTYYIWKAKPCTAPLPAPFATDDKSTICFAWKANSASLSYVAIAFISL